MNNAAKENLHPVFEEIFRPHLAKKGVELKFLKTISDTVIIDSVIFRRHGHYFICDYRGESEKFYWQFRVEGYDERRPASEQTEIIRIGYADREKIYAKDVAERAENERREREAKDRYAHVCLHGGFDDAGNYHIGTYGT